MESMTETVVDRYVAFFTNMSVERVILAYEQLPEEYRKRWGIETGFRVQDNVQSTTVAFDRDTALYVIPKSNTTIQGSYVWKDMVRDLISYPFLSLAEYFRREHSESGFFCG